jgi:hypothetical protein
MLDSDGTDSSFQVPVDKHASVPTVTSCLNWH